MRKQCVPGASPFFARAGDEAKTSSAYLTSCQHSNMVLGPHVFVLFNELRFAKDYYRSFYLHATEF